MKNYKLINNVLGWVAFVIAAFTYLSTIEPTASFWDCGEFIATAFKLEVGHPPGAPFFMILGRFFSLFAGSNLEAVPVMINAMSALASAFTILFLFWTVTHFVRKIFTMNSGELNMPKTIAIMGSGMVGALAYTFSDTFWFSAVEGEVYALSSLFTAVVFWAILKWENVADQPYSNRWIILIAYLMGLSIGVHLLNLLAIPAIGFVYFFKKYKVTRKAIEGFIILLLLPFMLLYMIPADGFGKILMLFLVGAGVWYFYKEKLHKQEGFRGMFAASGIAILVVAGIMYGIIPYSVTIASWFELLFVNSFGMPFNSGVIVYMILLIGGLVYGIIYTHKKKKAILNLILVGTTVILLGYSSFAMIVIRSIANPPMDENNPDNVFALLSYLNREQYGDRPLFFGQYYNAPLEDYAEGKPVYIQKDGKYVEADKKTEYVFNENFMTIFPRMYSSQDKHIEEYKQWGEIEGTPIEMQDGRGENTVLYKPKFSENLRYFYRYQMGFMYFRYFMWNFAGRQNDIQGHGGIQKGNWLSGVSFIDEMRLGPQDNIPDTAKNNPARNTYYFLPLILGLIGLAYQLKREGKGFWILLLLFFFTGIAIVIYLNQYPLQPRERDYAYAASFYAFSIWIGMSVAGLYELFSKKIPAKVSAGLATVLCLGVPTLMAAENWDDHDRSGRYTARDFAYNYLNSCEPNAILFTNGDNDTFPLWYAQEVEGIRTDIKIVNLSLFNTDWYIDQSTRKTYDAEPIPLSFTHDEYVQGKRDLIYLFEDPRFKGKYIPLKQAMDFVRSDNPKTKIRPGNSKEFDYIPSKLLRLPVDSAKVIEYGVVKPKNANEIVDNIDWKINKRHLIKAELMLLDMIAENEWKRPVYFAITVGSSSYLYLDDYFQLDGLTYRLVPIKTPNQAGKTGRIDTDIMYDNMMNKFRWGGINDPDVYLDENNLRMTMNFRNNFSRLAEELLKEGKRDSAVAVLDRCIEVMPNNKVPYNYFNIGIVEAYYKSGEFEKGNAVLADLRTNVEDDIEYYFSLEGKWAAQFDFEKRRSIAILRELMRVTKQYKQLDINKEIEESFNTLYEAVSGQPAPTGMY